ncbi:MAG: TonB-dependent receptor [Deltaproteobacteria bacterium]|nr:TonB-dependent receptor [Deltaproteobacteria bacterium]
MRRRGGGQRRLLTALAAVGVAAAGAPVAAARDDDASAMDTITVRASRTDQSLGDFPGAASVVGSDEIQLARPQLTLGESLLGIPGVFTQNRDNFAQDLRIAIRGFGARANFGIRGIKLIVDGIPATLPDGQGQVDTIQLSTARRIEVLRGPAATLYGSAAGGVIRIETEEGPDTPFLQGRTAFGSHGYRQYDVKGGGSSGPVRYLLGVSRQELDGYRDHSRMENVLANGKLSWTPDESSKLTVIGNYLHAPKAQDPGGLTSTQVEEDRRQARQRNKDFDAGEELDQASLGLSYVRTFGIGHELTAATYHVWRDFENRLPFTSGGAVEYDRYFGGASLQYRYEDQFFGMNNRLLVGVDVDAQRDERKRRDNDEGSVGDVVFDQDEDVTALRAFLQDELALGEDFELTAGVGFDHLRYEVDDAFVDLADDDLDDSGRRNFDEWSPMVALRWSRWRALNAYARISTSFEPPSTAELANPDASGGFNSDIEAQRTVNYEIGIKGLLPGTLRYELVGFWMRTKDELVPFESDLGRTFFENAGRTTRGGIELSFRYQPVEGLTAAFAYTWSVFEFDKFRTADGSFDGNSIPGVPDHHLYGELFYRSPFGLYGGLEFRWVGPFYADNANEEKTDSYFVSSLRLGHSQNFGRWEIGPYLGIQNLFGKRYIDNVRINAFGGRYFEPAPKRSYFGGLTVAYHFEGL